jgi:hypothetical protein
MRKSLYVVLLLSVFLPGSCKKDEIPLAGTETIETTLFGTGPYYAYGFSFSLAKQISTLDGQ